MAFQIFSLISDGPGGVAPLRYHKLVWKSQPSIVLEVYHHNSKVSYEFQKRLRSFFAYPNGPAYGNDI